MQAVFKESTQNIYTVREISRYKTRQRMKASVMQKVMGGMMLLIGIITPIVTQDATISVLAIPLGLYWIILHGIYSITR